MMQILRIIYLSALSIFFLDIAFATNHYVDKNANGLNNGTSWTNAWQSFSNINWNAMGAGDTLFISGGMDSTTYNENLTVGASGNTSGLLVIRPGLSTGHNGRVIIAGGTSGNNITVQDKKYVRLEKLEITMARGTTQGIYVKGTGVGAANVVYIDSCSIISRTSTAENWCMRIDGWNTPRAITWGDSIFVRYGYYENTRATPIGVQCDAIIAQCVQNIFIIGNTIFVKNDWPTAPAPTHNDCFSTDNETGNLTIAGNQFYNLQTQNVQSQAVILGSLSGYLKFYNNVVYGHFQHLGGYWPQTMSIYSSPYACDYYIYSNTFQGGSNSYVLMMETGSNSTVYLKNNIFDASSGNAVRVHFRVTTPTYSQIDGNLYGDLSDANNKIMSTPDGSLSMANLISRGAETTGIGANRWNVDPLFTNETSYDYSLQATSPAINQGVTLGPPYNTDIDGIPRPQGAGYDISAYEFTTGGGGGNNPPYQPTNPNPANGSINQPVNLTLTWSCTDPDGDPLTYDVYFGTNNNPPLASTNQSNASFNPGQLDNSTTYYWKIVAKDNQGATTTGPVWNFSTETAGGGNNPPNQPSNPNPANGAIDQSVNLILSWSCTDPDGDPLTYDVYLGTSNNPPLASSNQSNASYNPGQLNNSTTYYWKIVAKDNQSATTSGPVWNFSTEATGGGDVIPPELIGIQIVEPNELVLDFSEPLDSNQITNLQNYDISNQIIVLGVDLNETQQRLCLTTSNHDSNFVYSIEIGGLTDTAGNVISAQANSAFYKLLDIGQVNYFEYLIESVYASATTDTNTSPQKTLDGLVNGDPDPNSRWAAEIMPQWIEYDIGSVKTITLIASSFYRWNFGRIYQYSIQISNDATQWTEIVTNQSSSSQEWTLNEMPTLTYARYVRIICLSSTESNWANLWEAQIFGPSQVPVEFLLFTAEVNNINNVVLSWTTATETNNHSFEVERKNSNNDFLNIGTVPGHGTTTEQNDYYFTDSNVEIGFYTYRIKQNDFSGQFIYSNEIEVEIKSPLEFKLNQNFPNPFNPITTIQYSVPETGWIKLSVFNAIGQEVVTLVNEEKQVGLYKVEFSATGGSAYNLPSGIYFYKLQSGNFVETRKMVLLK
jgi:hypothetical protein